MVHHFTIYGTVLRIQYFVVPYCIFFAVWYSKKVKYNEVPYCDTSHRKMEQMYGELLYFIVQHFPTVPYRKKKYNMVPYGTILCTILWYNTVQ